MKKLIIAISALAITGALATGLLALGITSPEFVLARAMKRASQMQSVHVVGTATGPHATFFDAERRIRITPNIQTDAQVAALMDPGTRLSFDMDLNFLVWPDVDATVVSGGPKNAPMRSRLRMVWPFAYLRLDEVPTKGRGQPGYVGQWYEMAAFDAVSWLTGMEPRRFSPAQENVWRSLFAASRLFIPDGPIHTATVGGKNVWIIPVHMSAEGRAAFRTKEANAFVGDGSVMNIFAQPDWSEWYGTLTIDRRSYDLLAAHMTNVPEHASPGPRATTLDVALSRHNESVEIVVPERTRPYIALDPNAPPGLAAAGTATSTLVEGERTGSPLRPAESTTSTGSTDDTDGDGLADVLEAFYGSNARNPDSDGDGRSDGDEVAAGDDPVGPGKLFDFRGTP